MTIRPGIRVRGALVWAFVASVLVLQTVCGAGERGGPAPCLPLELFNGPCLPHCNPCCCPDDYRPKCLPVEPCRVSGCVEPCYCAKCLPSVPPPVRRGCCDDYCPKSFSLPCVPLGKAWLTCGPPEACHNRQTCAATKNSCRK